jgi:hypothetical protein
MMIDNVLDVVKYGIQREFIKNVKGNSVFASFAEGTIVEDSINELDLNHFKGLNI